MFTLILFNILFWATLACLIKPSLLAKYTGGEPLPRWIFLVLLFVIVGIKQAISKPAKSQQAQTENCVLGRYGKMDCSPQGIVPTKPDTPYIPQASPAAEVNTDEAAASY